MIIISCHQKDARSHWRGVQKSEKALSPWRRSGVLWLAELTSHYIVGRWRLFFKKQLVVRMITIPWGQAGIFSMASVVSWWVETASASTYEFWDWYPCSYLARLDPGHKSQQDWSRGSSSGWYVERARWRWFRVQSWVVRGFQGQKGLFLLRFVMQGPSIWDFRWGKQRRGTRSWLQKKMQQSLLMWRLEIHCCSVWFTGWADWTHGEYADRNTYVGRSPVAIWTTK